MLKVWKLNYLFQLNRMVGDVVGNSTGLKASGKYNDKYVALHHLSINIGKKLNLGVFEWLYLTEMIQLRLSTATWIRLFFTAPSEQQFWRQR